jgi:ZIP family zinc transporter
VIALIDRMIPTLQNPHEVRTIETMESEVEAEIWKRRNLNRMGLFSALAIAIHNFPEGLATFIATLEDPALGISIAIAIAIHNIPEGIAVSVPIYHATGSRRKALGLSFLSGLAEPVGALLGFFLLRPFMTDVLFGVLFAGVAGIMVFISLDELLPTAENYGEHHITIYGLIAGMAVMATSIVLMA